jgi:hypothetical protein
MEPIRLAKPEEVENLKGKSDLGPGCIVVAMDGRDGKTDYAVIRTVTEIDPVFFDASAPDSRKALFIWGLENMLRFQGVPFYYFNVDTADEKWQKVIKNWGGEQTSPTAEYRFKKNL